MLGKVIGRVRRSMGNAAIVAALAALTGVALWVFVLGGPSGESQPLASQPPASQAELTPTSMPTAPLPTETQPPTPPAAEEPPPPPPPPAEEPPAPPAAEEPPPPPPPPAEELPPPPPPPPPLPPSDDDLYVEVTNFGVTSSAFFYVYFENRNPDWSVCGLVFRADVLDTRTGRWLTGETVEMGNLGSLEGVESGRPSIVRGVTGIQDYTIIADWAWC